MYLGERGKQTYKEVGLEMCQARSIATPFSIEPLIRPSRPSMVDNLKVDDSLSDNVLNFVMPYTKPFFKRSHLTYISMLLNPCLSPEAL